MFHYIYDKILKLIFVNYYKMKKKQFLLIPILALCSLFSAWTSAVEVTHLNEAFVPVASRSSEDRSLALQQALSNVMLKNSGSVDVLQHPLIIEQLRDPNSLLAQYSYKDVDGQLMLHSTFESNGIVHLLRKAKLAVWGKQRPLVLMWLSANVDGQRKIISDESKSVLRENFREDAENRGLPLIFPLMDLDDLMKVRESDIRGFFPQQIADASNRYSADYYVIANLNQLANGRINYQLSLFTMNHHSMLPLYQHEGNIDSQSDAADAIMSDLSGYFSSQYAIADNGYQQDVQLTLHGINTLTKLVDAEKYIKQLSAIKSLQLAEIKGDKLTFTVTLYGEVSDLKRQLNLDHFLKPIRGLQETDLMGRIDLAYQWQ